MQRDFANIIVIVIVAVSVVAFALTFGILLTLSSTSGTLRNTGRATDSSVLPMPTDDLTVTPTSTEDLNVFTLLAPTATEPPASATFTLAPTTRVPTSAPTAVPTTVPTAVPTTTVPATSTATDLPTRTATHTPDASPTASATRTVSPPAATASATPSATATRTATLTVTATRTATARATVPTAAPTTAPTRVLAVIGCGDSARITITSPRPGQRLSGTFVISGTVSLENARHYRVEVRPEADATARFWSLSLTPVTNGELGRIDAGVFGKGLHWLRVVIVGDNGAELPGAECIVPVIFE